MSNNSPISYQPTLGLSYNPNEEKYWDEKLLNQEIERTFEVCHGCRMCFKFCDSFPDLFKFIDQNHNGDVSKITETETKTVMDSCFQCKLCEVQCPYTPRDNHPYQLDFPKLVHRYQAIRAKKTKKFSLRTMFLKNPDFSGKLARSSLGMVNVMNRVQIHRYFFEKIVGIHRKKLLPDFALKTFESWAKKRGLIKKKVGAEAVLFQTCYVQNNEPQIGKDTLEVLEKNKVDCNCVSGLKCCGMPAWESGDLETLRANAKHNLKILMPHVNAGSKVLAINPTCAMMMRREYIELLDESDKADAQKLAAAVKDPSEYLWDIRNEPRFNTQFKSSPGEQVAYHAPCHLRAQAVGFKGRDLIKKIPGVSTSFVTECCGHDGTYAMKVESFEASARIGQKSFTAMQSTPSKIWATDCPLAAVQFQQHAGVKPMHPMSVLARAYREDGFKDVLP